MHKYNEPSFFLTNSTGDLQGELEGFMIVLNCPPKPKIVWLEGWEEQELFSDGLDEGF